VPGLPNEGLFALHALTVDAQRRPEWRAASGKVKKVASPTAVGIGVGRRGRTETYVEVQTSLLADDYLWLLFLTASLPHLETTGRRHLLYRRSAWR
jgi:hypothetical protein